MISVGLILPLVILSSFGQSRQTGSSRHKHRIAEAGSCSELAETWNIITLNSPTAHPSHYYLETEEICRECFNRLTPQEQAEAKRPPQLHRMTTTAFTLDGFCTVQTLGVVRGITVRSRSIFGTIGASLQTLVGGNITLFTELCERTRADAFDMVLRHATEMGANAVVGVRYDATEVMNGVSEVLCYGTAVVVQPVTEGASA
jgi:uncharacterized protein YbjQ (UPF0145 family)